VTAAHNSPRRYTEKPTDAGVSAVQLLEREGIRVHYPQDQTCCGQPAYTSGFPDEARVVAKAQLTLFPGTWPVIVPSGSCAGMMRHHWPRLFADDLTNLPRAESIASRTFELTEFLLDVLHVEWKPSAKQQPETVVLHTSCSARREMGTHLHARALLAKFGDVEVRQQEHEAECCGFGGSFSVKHPEISADAGCLLNLNGTLEKRGSALRGQHIATYFWNRVKEGT
jgi:L-lactate dehydrogenase complex protein LldE